MTAVAARESAPDPRRGAITKLLVANRGEIAIRAFRAATGLGISTVAVYASEDSGSAHRIKADEAWEIGKPGHPVRAYLDAAGIIAVARRCGADAVYPGYGFLSESPEFAEACEAAGLLFVGPTAEVLTLTGNKMRAQQAARAAGLPVLGQSGPVATAAAAMQEAERLGFPLFVKAAAGGGGRGLRRVEHPDELASAVESAMREAEGAFGDPTVFLEQAVIRPRHIEVQILADAAGEVVHLYERDCSLQRRHQKVIEVAPAPALDEATRQRICADAVAFARSVGYRNAGTVEFLLGQDGSHAFIEMNPRIQVEHTVTEEVTDVDLVESQLRIAGGATLADLGLDQSAIRLRGAALQCRVTAEDPANGFRPGTGRIIAYRQPGGSGVRLDGGVGYVGAEISPHFDSLVVKLTCRGRDFPAAVRRASQALAEFRVRGVTTNLAFLRAVLDEEDFVAGGITTSFLDDRPHLADAAAGLDRATRLLRYLADVTVNRPNGTAPSRVDPLDKVPTVPAVPAVPAVPPAVTPDGRIAGGPAPIFGSRRRLQGDGALAFARWLRERQAVAVTDTTLRDAHQSILATRVRTVDLVHGARLQARHLPGLLSLECWGGATYDVALRFLHEDPWQRLDELRAAAPDLCLQMLLRGRNTVGYRAYPDAVCRRFVAEAAAAGIDIFRVFDALNDVEQMRPAIDAVVEAGALVEGTLCYSGDLADPAETLYTLDYYLRLAEQLAAAGSHVLCIKDMAGLLRAPAARRLVTALRSRFDLPVHLHTHDTAGGQLATYLAALDAGVDAIDGAMPPLSGMTSQPSLAAIVAATDHTERQTGLSLDAIGDLEPYWEAVRRLYRPFEAGLDAPTGTVYRHEIPGGQLSNLRQQAIALGLGDRFEEVERTYADCNVLLGRPIKVTPSSKAVGDLALHLVASHLDTGQLESDPAAADLPDSVIAFLRGELGTPEGGFPEPFRTTALAGRREAEPMATLSALQLAELARRPRQTLSELLFPGPAASYADMRAMHGDLSVLPTGAFLYGMEPGVEVAVDLEPGVRLLIELEAVGEPDEFGMRSLVVRLNGELRPIEARDRTVAVSARKFERADPANPHHVAAPFRGVVTPGVAVGDAVTAGQVVATIEAMKMESAISAPADGVVARLLVEESDRVEPDDLIMELAPRSAATSPGD